MTLEYMIPVGKTRDISSRCPRCMMDGLDGVEVEKMEATSHGVLTPRLPRASRPVTTAASLRPSMFSRLFLPSLRYQNPRLMADNSSIQRGRKPIYINLHIPRLHPLSFGKYLKYSSSSCNSSSTGVFHWHQLQHLDEPLASRPTPHQMDNAGYLLRPERAISTADMPPSERHLDFTTTEHG